MKRPSFSANHEEEKAPAPNRTDRPWEDFYERHVDTVYRVCLSMTGNRQDAEDAVQSVFIKLIESEKTFVSTEHEKAWLITAARNQCRDLHRKWWKKKVIHLDTNSDLAFRDEAGHHSEIEEGLLQLPPTHRLILYLYYYEGYKQAEIATMLKMKLNTVKTKMRNARKRLKLELGEDRHE